MRVLLISLLLVACDNSTTMRIDDCTGLVAERCVTFHLTAEPDLANATLDTIVMWVGYQASSSGFHNVRLQTATHAPTQFPVAVGLHLPEDLVGPAAVKIEALIGPGPLAYRATSVEPNVGAHVDEDVIMESYTKSGCFDQKFTSATIETDVDCGNTCPPCATGQRCGSNLDCLSTVCGDGASLMMCN
jgi:hypothetical protein